MAPIHSCEIKTRKEGGSGAWKPVRTRAAVPRRGPSRKGVGKFILRATRTLIRITPTNIRAFQGLWIKLSDTAGTLAEPAAGASPARPWITIKGTIKTVASSRMVCMKVTTVKSEPAISSLKTTICVRPPGTLPRMLVAGFNPVRREIMVPTNKLNRIIEVVARSMAGSCLNISRPVATVNALPSM